MGKKKKAGKLPKEVLGIKVPKELRKAGERLIEQAQGPAGRQAIAGALTAVAGAAMTAALSRQAAKGAEAAPKPAPPGGTGGDASSGTGPSGGPGTGTRGNDLGEALARVADTLVGQFTQRRS